MSEWSIYLSVLTISAFSIERYLAICQPLKDHVLSDLSRVCRIIPAIWLLGFVCALPMSLQFSLIPNFTFANKINGSCSMSDLMSRGFKGSSFISSIVFFILPILLICNLYILMGIRLRHSRRIAENTRVNVRGTKAIRMLGELLCIILTEAHEIIVSNVLYFFSFGLSGSSHRILRLLGSVSFEATIIYILYEFTTLRY